MPEPTRQRARAPRMDPEVRRGLIADAAESLLVEHDCLLVTFDEVADAAGVSRALVHAYLGDRRGLVDAVQVQIVGRLDTWVGHGLTRASTTTGNLRAIVQGTCSFVEANHESWGVLGSTGGFDHPALHGVRARWAKAIGPDDPIGSQAAVGALLMGVGTWTTRGIDPAVIEDRLLQLIGDQPSSTPDVG